MTFDDMTRQLSEAGRREGSESGHVPKSRRIGHYPESGPTEHFRSSHGYSIQQQLGQQQPLDDAPRHNLYYEDPSMFITQSLNPNIIITSSVASDGSQYGYVETHRPASQFGHDFTQFDT